MTSNVLYILNSANVGGGNRSMEALWKGVKITPFIPIVACPSDGPYWDILKNTDLNTMILKLDQPTWKAPFDFIRSFRYLIDLLKKFEIQLIHANDLLCARPIILCAYFLKIPVICHVRFYQEKNLCKWVFKWLPKPKGFIFNSHEMKRVTGEHLNKFCPRTHQFVIHNAVDLSKFAYQATNKHIRRIGIIGNLAKVKGHEDFLDMAAILTEMGHDLFYDIIGDELNYFGRMAELKSYADALAISPRITFHGFVSDVASLLNDIDIIVCTSHQEPFGRCLIEAMACGKPVVATNVGGIPEVIIDNETGFLVPPHSPRLLAQSINKLILNKLNLNEMGKKARDRVENKFSIESHTKNVIEVYNKILKKF